MQPSQDKRMKLQTGVARARMMFKQHLEWLPGFVFEPASKPPPAPLRTQSVCGESGKVKANTQEVLTCKWFYFGNDYKVKEKQFTREDLRLAEMAVKKLVVRFPRALPKIVDDVDRWQARMNSLLGMLKAWVHDDQPPYLEGLFNADHLNERWLKQFRESRKDYPDLKTLLDAIAFLELSGQAEPNSDSVRWVVENAFALTLINQSQHLSPTERLNLQFKFWQMRKEMPAQLLVTICRFVTNEPAFNCPTKDLFTAVNFYKQSIAKARKRAPLQSTLGLASEVVPADPGRIGLEILTVLDSALQTKPKRRASVFQMLESFLTPEMMFRAFELQQKLAADEKRLLRILRQFQSGSRLEFRSKIKQPEIDDELQTCEVETKPLCAVLAAFKIALNLLNSNELEPKNWLQLLPKIPENIRCQVFTKWHEKSYFTKYKSGDLNYFASQLGKLLAKKDLPESFKAHWQSFANQPHSNDMVIEACQDFEGNRKIHAATIALLARLLELPGQPIASESYSALSSFAASNNDLGYLTTLIVAIGEPFFRIQSSKTANCLKPLMIRMKSGNT